MKALISFLLPVLIGTAQAASESAKAYLLSASKQHITSNTPILTPEQARLVLSQRLGVSQYHNVDQASDEVLAYINEFGGRRQELFPNDAYAADTPSQLVILLEGVTAKMTQPLISSWGSKKPAFEIATPPSKTANIQLIRDMTAQSSEHSSPKSCSLEDSLNPYKEECWSGNTNVILFDVKSSDRTMDDFARAQKSMLKFVEKDVLEVIVVIMPESRRMAKHVANPYGTYDMPTRYRNSPRQLEEPMTETSKMASSSGSSKLKQPQTFQSAPAGIIPMCHASVDSCALATNNCSGHGECFRKYGSAGADGGSGSSCYTCGCVPTVVTNKSGNLTTHWAGAACSKKDISGQFWLLAGFSIILVGLVSWAIGMMFAIGEEKLPGVIGAGVSGPKAR